MILLSETPAAEAPVTSPVRGVALAVQARRPRALADHPRDGLPGQPAVLEVAVAVYLAEEGTPLAPEDREPGFQRRASGRLLRRILV